MDKDNEKPNDLIVEFEDGQIDLFDEGPAKKADVIVEDAPEKPRRKAAKKADTDDATATLKRQLEEANARVKAEADARAAEAAKRAEAERELADSRKRIDDAEGLSITNAKSAAQAELKQLKSDLAKAHNEGEYDKLGDIHEQIARASAILFHLDREEADYKERKETPKEPAKKAEAPAQPKAPSNVDEWLSTVQLPDRAKEFFRQHPEFAPLGKSKAKYYLLSAAHEDAIGEGITFDSNDYYNFLNKRLIDDDGDEEGDDDMADDADDRARAAAPVSRSSGTPRNGSTPQRVKLTRDQREAAEAMGLSPESYARFMLQAQKDGKIQP